MVVVLHGELSLLMEETTIDHRTIGIRQLLPVRSSKQRHQVLAIVHRLHMMTMGMIRHRLHMLLLLLGQSTIMNEEGEIWGA
jgi:hypothetical protein